MKKQTNNSAVDDDAADYDFSGGKRGAVINQAGKTRITMWIDNDILHEFKIAAEAAGRGYQTVMNAALREQMAHERVSMEQRVENSVRNAFRDMRIVIVDGQNESTGSAANDLGDRAMRRTMIRNSSGRTVMKINRGARATGNTTGAASTPGRNSTR